MLNADLFPSKRTSTCFPLLLGLLGVMLSLLPAVILGSDGYVMIPDQLDGEVPGYILHAKNFLASNFSEFMNGMSSTALTPPSIGSVLFYMVMPPFEAYLGNYIFVTLLAFVGMYLLLNELLDNMRLSAFAALMFSQLPFYSVYGLSIMGQPLLFFACIRLWKGKTPLVSFALTILFALFSSFALVGFADVILLLGLSIVMQIRKHRNARYAWIQSAGLIAIYLLTNIPLLGSFFASDTIPHRATWTASASSALDNFKNIFLDGHYHAVSLHSGMVIWAVAFVLGGFLLYDYWQSDKAKKKLWGMSACLVTAVGIAAFYALWRCSPIVSIRNKLGGLFVSFQFDRIYWLYPTIWFVLFAFILWFIVHLTRRTVIQKILAWICLAILTFSMGSTLYANSVFRQNIHTMAGEGSAVSWDEFYSPPLFQEIEEYIGLPQESYRVASVALYPSVPLYNGFYCIDGYSNNYAMDYKQQFRKIISKELEKSSELRAYFDDWGNRCYIFVAELGKNYFFTKDSQESTVNMELSADALRDMSCDYILSGLEIENPSSSGLSLERNFEHEDSPYRVWLYKVTGD